MESYLYQDLYDLEDKHWWHIAKRRIVLTFIEKFIKPKNPKILDIGCGTGKNLESMSKIGEVWGVDSSEEAIEFCKKRGLKNLKLATAESTKFPSNSFNVVTLLDVLEHTNDHKTLKETRKILKNNGIVIITVPAFSWLWSKWDVVLHHKRRYTKQSLNRVLQQNNFEIVKISYMYSFLVLPALIIRFLKSLFLKNSYPSDFKLSSPLINSLISKISPLESFFIENTSIPIGTSLIAVAKKNEE